MPKTILVVVAFGDSRALRMATGELWHHIFDHVKNVIGQMFDG